MRVLRGGSLEPPLQLVARRRPAVPCLWIRVERRAPPSRSPLRAPRARASRCRATRWARRSRTDGDFLKPASSNWTYVLAVAPCAGESGLYLSIYGATHNRLQDSRGRHARPQRDDPHGGWAERARALDHAA